MLDAKVFLPKPTTNDGDIELIDINGFQHIDEASVLYCERFMEFLIDLLSQLPTRRYNCHFSVEHISVMFKVANFPVM